MYKLAPIEKPASWLMRLIYYISRKQFGKIITPLKTVYVRLPIAFSLWANRISSLEKKLPLPPDLVLLIRIHTAQLNTCGFCIDIGQAKAIRQFSEQKKFFHVADFATWPGFSPKEKAALQFVHELTVYKKLTPSTYQEAAAIFDDKELSSIAWVVASEHVYNMINAAFDIGSDGLCMVAR